MNKYYPLHTHCTSGSIGDSILKIKEYVAKAKEYGLDSLAISDHGSLSSMYEFYDTCCSNNIKPIIGCEVYEASNRLTKEKSVLYQNNHLVLIAKNNKGFSNLLSIVNDANLVGFYGKPRTDISYMSSRGEGIIALSGCLAGSIPQSILANDPDKSLDLIEQYKSIFDEFYLELQPGNFEEQLTVNSALIELADYTDTPLVITNDIHYLHKADWEAHDYHVKIQRHINHEGAAIYPDKCYYFMDYLAIKEAFNDTIPETILDEAIYNAFLIANKCIVTLPKTVAMPKVEDAIYILNNKCFSALDSISYTLDDISAYTSRLIHELDTIVSLGFADYFLIVEDFIKYARENNIPVGPGRGSVGGSLVAFLLNITLADPIKYDLIFERFLSKHRKSLPDIDIDFGSEDRYKMFEYAINKYGSDHCSLVSTLQMRKSKSALRDAARCLGLDIGIGDRAAKLIPEVYYDDEGEKFTDLSIKESLLISDKLQELQKEYPDLFDMAIKISDVPSSTSIHAAGLLISPNKLTDMLPLINSKYEGLNATSLDLSDAESVAIKFDFLSLASLSVYDKTQQQANDFFDVLTNTFDDSNVWNLIGSKYTTGLFQISSPTYKQRMPHLKPKSIEDLAACLALVRGPCISSKQDKLYIDILNNKKEVDPIHELYYSATKDTLGILLYQEQLMTLAVNFGFSLEEGYNLIKFVSKKKQEELKAFKDKFVEKATTLNLSNNIIEAIWKIILDSGLYSFNKSHATTYAILTYISAYFKTYYPKIFLINLLTNACIRKKKEEIIEAIKDCRRYGFKFKPLSINTSSWEFTIDEDGYINIGFCALKAFGYKAYEELVQNRPYISLEDFLDKVKKKNLGKRNVEPMILIEAFEEFNNDYEEVYEEYISLISKEPQETIKVARQELVINSSLSDREEMLLGGRFISDPSNYLDSFNFNNIKIKAMFSCEGCIVDVKNIKDKNKNNMAFLTLATGDGYIDCTVFSNTYTKYKSLIKKDNSVIIKAKKDKEFSCIIQEIKFAKT